MSTFTPDTNPDHGKGEGPRPSTVAARQLVFATLHPRRPGRVVATSPRIPDAVSRAVASLCGSWGTCTEPDFDVAYYQSPLEVSTESGDWFVVGRVLRVDSDRWIARHPVVHHVLLFERDDFDRVGSDLFRIRETGAFDGLWTPTLSAEIEDRTVDPVHIEIADTPTPVPECDDERLRSLAFALERVLHGHLVLRARKPTPEIEAFLRDLFHLLPRGWRRTVRFASFSFDRDFGANLGLLHAQDREPRETLLGLADHALDHEVDRAEPTVRRILAEVYPGRVAPMEVGGDDVELLEPQKPRRKRRGARGSSRRRRRRQHRVRRVTTALRVTQPIFAVAIGVLVMIVVAIGLTRTKPVPRPGGDPEWAAELRDHRYWSPIYGAYTAYLRAEHEDPNAPRTEEARLRCRTLLTTHYREAVVQPLDALTSRMSVMPRLPVPPRDHIAALREVAEDAGIQATESERLFHHALSFEVTNRFPEDPLLHGPELDETLGRLATPDMIATPAFPFARVQELDAIRHQAHITSLTARSLAVVHEAFGFDVPSVDLPRLRTISAETDLLVGTWRSDELRGENVTLWVALLRAARELACLRTMELETLAGYLHGDGASFSTTRPDSVLALYIRYRDEVITATPALADADSWSDAATFYARLPEFERAVRQAAADSAPGPILADAHAALGAGMAESGWHRHLADLVTAATIIDDVVARPETFRSYVDAWADERPPMEWDPLHEFASLIFRDGSRARWERISGEWNDGVGITLAGLRWTASSPMATRGTGSETPDS